MISFMLGLIFIFLGFVFKDAGNSKRKEYEEDHRLHNYDYTIQSKYERMCQMSMLYGVGIDFNRIIKDISTNLPNIDFFVVRQMAAMAGAKIILNEMGYDYSVWGQPSYLFPRLAYRYGDKKYICNREDLEYCIREGRKGEFQHEEETKQLMIDLGLNPDL